MRETTKLIIWRLFSAGILSSNAEALCLQQRDASQRHKNDRRTNDPSARIALYGAKFITSAPESK